MLCCLPRKSHNSDEGTDNSLSSKTDHLQLPQKKTHLNPSDRQTLQQQGHSQQVHHQKHLLSVDNSGHVNLEEINSALLLQLNSSERDLLFCDPQKAGFPRTRLFVREKVVLVCLEGLRLAILEHRALVFSIPGKSLQEGGLPYSNSPAVRDLVSRLRISPHIEGKAVYVDKSLPFELLVLEWALSTATQALSAEVHDLLDHAERVHEKLTKKISRSALLEFRRSKFEARIMLSRTGSLRQELQGLLLDEQDLLGLHLSCDRPKAFGPLQTRRQRRRRKLKSKALHSQVNEGDLRALTESSNLIEFYSFQLAGVEDALHGLSDFSRQTEDFMKMSIKAQRLCIGLA